jgi:AcrR family transcriptional regulator
MSPVIEKQIHMNQEDQTTLLRLLSQEKSEDHAVWRDFWESLLGPVPKTAAEGVDALAAVFDEGVSCIAAAAAGSEAMISKWITAVITEGQLLGIDERSLSERLLARQVCRQVTQREQARPQASHTREKIMAAALAVFSDKGFHGATVDEIADYAGLGKGTVYRHFVNKQGLFTELIRSKVAELEKAVTAAVDPEGDVLEIIETYLRTYFAFFDHNRDLYRVLIQEQSDFGAEVKALYIGNILRKVPLLKRRIYQAAKDGQLKQMDFQTVFYGVMGFIDGVMQKWLAREGVYSLVDEIPTVLETLYYGFVNQDYPNLEAVINYPG